MDIASEMWINYRGYTVKLSVKGKFLKKSFKNALQTETE